MSSLAINAYHGDSAACIVVDGKLVAAAEEERFRRIKHWAGFPSEAIRYCLHEAGARLSDVGIMAVNSDPKRGPAASGWRYLLQKRPNLGLRRQAAAARASSGRASRRCWPRRFRASASAARSSASSITSRTWRRRSTCRRSTRRSPSPSTASATSPARPGAWRAATAIDVDGRVYFPHSLGIFYQAHDPVPRLPALRRRVQGHGPRALRRADASCDQMRRRRADARRTARFELNLDYFRHQREKVDYDLGRRRADQDGTMYTPALEELLGPARAPERAARAAPPRPRALGAGHVRGAFFHLLDDAAPQVPGRRRSCSPAAARLNSVANGKVTDAHAVQARLRAGGGRRRGRRDRRGAVRALRARAARRRARLRHGSRLLGPGVSTTTRSQALLDARGRQDRRASAARCERDRRRCRRSASAPPSAIADGRRRRLVPGAHGVGPARARQPLDPGRPAPRRHEGHPQPQDQAARVVPPVRAVDPARARRGVVRAGRRRPVHDAGLPDPRGEARRRSRR